MMAALAPLLMAKLAQSQGGGAGGGGAAPPGGPPGGPGTGPANTPGDAAASASYTGPITTATTARVIGFGCCRCRWSCQSGFERVVSQPWSTGGASTCFVEQVVLSRLLRLLCSVRICAMRWCPLRFSPRWCFCMFVWLVVLSFPLLFFSLCLCLSFDIFLFTPTNTHNTHNTHTHYSHLYTLSGNVASHAIFDHGQQWCPEPWQQPRARGCGCSWQQEPC